MRVRKLLEHASPILFVEPEFLQERNERWLRAAGRGKGSVDEEGKRGWGWGGVRSDWLLRMRSNVIDYVHVSMKSLCSYLVSQGCK